MTTININKLLLEQALNALLLPCDRWNKQQFLIVKGAIESLNAALSAPATTPEQRMKELEAENEQLRKDAERYQWLAEYLVSDDESYDDAIVAATTVKEVDSVIDNAMGASPWAHCFCGVRPQAQHVWQAATDAALSAPATAPAWNNVPTCEGLWLCDEGDENPYRFTCHDISMPLNPHLAGEGERWYGPIPEDKP